MEHALDIAMVMQTVFENVIGMKIVEVRRTVERVWPETEYAVAALPLRGIRAHYLSIILQRDSICAVASAMRTRYGVNAYVPSEMIFAEIINIYAGNLAVELQRFGKELTIGVPLSPSEYECHKKEMDMVRMTTDSSILFKLCFSV
ncbi:hypothetical protein LJC74_02055 [Eubacteriales bacterium OttesenSCG-928-A19]|nr:hypothetical protein [Eubacteriales bacterium OttesenSCG-928-A19]